MSLPRSQTVVVSMAIGALIVVPVLAVYLALTGGSRVAPVELAVQTVPAAAPIVPAPVRRSGVPQVASSWVAQQASRTGIPGPALHAYGDAVLSIARTQPGCHLGWTTLAGIGAVESENGTIGGRTLLADGYSSSPIIGPALDGHGFAAIRPSRAATSVHGDSVWDHAVGPMQFLSSSWARWGADGDGDGRADPLDIDDAALATARYLCADDHDLATVAGWNAAVLSYNHDPGYVVSVYDAANAAAGRA